MRVLSKKSIKKSYPTVDSDWTLFLDRDGVINRKLDGTYVMNPDQLIMLDGVEDAIALFSKVFGRIIVVTNQQGVGKELMTHEDITRIHDKMMDFIMENNGRIDQVYYCPDLAYEDSPNRKPNPGMGLQAKIDFPEIDFRKSIMVGDSKSDIEFGRSLMMTTVSIESGNNIGADFAHSSLLDFSLYLINN